MNILISFIPNVLPVFNHGGSTKILKQLVKYLSEKGHKITIVCNERKDNYEVYELFPNVTVMPIYKFRESYPNPYNTSPDRLAYNVNLLYELSLTNDILFNFDTDFIFADIFKHIPVIYSLRDYIYPEALQGAFLIRSGDIIVNSQFVKDSFLATAGKFFPQIKKHTHLIPNGIDTQLFMRKPPKQIREFINLSDSDFPIILYPHRPGPEKGINEVINVIEKLVKFYNLKETKLLLARGIDEDIDSSVNEYYNSIYESAKEKHIENNIVFHKWIPPELMPEYYSLGDVTLSLGNIVEAFSNTTLESLACGTPIVATKTSCFRTFLPDWCIDKVDYGDDETAASLTYALITSKNKDRIKRIRRYLEKNFSVLEMCRNYEKLIKKQKIQREFKYYKNSTQINVETKLCLAPWCYLSEKGIYNDYLHDYYKNENLEKLLKMYSVFTPEIASKYNISLDFIIKHMEIGFLIKEEYLV